MRHHVLALPLLLALAGCFKTNLDSFADSGSPGREVRVWSHSLLLGLIPLNTVDARAACGDKGVWAVSTRQNGWNLILAGLTTGIYTPTVAKITCRG